MEKLLASTRVVLFLLFLFAPLRLCGSKLWKVKRMKIMKRRTFLKTLALLALPVFAGCKASRAEPTVQHVFIVSFDGGKPAVMQKSAMPTLFEMAKSGAADWNAKTVFPSVTLPSHMAMLTGLDIPRHGIFWNDYQPRRGVVKVPTIFKLGARRGLHDGNFRRENQVSPSERARHGR